MSSYLYFKKKDVELCCFQSCCEIYEWFHTGYEWKEMTSKDFEFAIDHCKEEITKVKKNIKECDEELKHLISLEDIETVVREKQEEKEDLARYKTYLNYIYLLQDIFEYETENLETGKLMAEKMYMMKD